MLSWNYPFLFRILRNIIFRNFFAQKTTKIKFLNSAPKSWVNPIENSNFELCLKKLFFISPGGLFFIILLTNNIFPGILCQNITRKFFFQIFEKFLAIPFENIRIFFWIFDLNHEGYTLRKNSRCATMLKIHFYNPERLLLYSEY